MLWRLWFLAALGWTAFWLFILWPYWMGSYGPSAWELSMELVFVLSPWIDGFALPRLYRFVRYGRPMVQPPERATARWVD